MRLGVKICMACGIWLFALPLISHAVGQKDYSPADIVLMLQSGDEQQQKKALKGLYENAEHTYIKDKYKVPEIKNTLYELVSKTAKPSERLTCHYEDPLWSRVIYAMGILKDTRALPYLVTNISCRSYISESLAVMGEPAVDPMIDKLKNGTRAEKGGAFEFFEILLTTKAPTIANGLGEVGPNRYARTYEPRGAIKEKIRAALKKSLNDPDPDWSFVAIRVLRLAGDPEDKKILDDAYNKNPNRDTPEKKAKREQQHKAKEEWRKNENIERKKKGLPSLEEEAEQKFRNYKGD